MPEKKRSKSEMEEKFAGEEEKGVENGGRRNLGAYLRFLKKLWVKNLKFR